MKAMIPVSHRNNVDGNKYEKLNCKFSTLTSMAYRHLFLYSSLMLVVAENTDNAKSIMSSI